MIRKDIDSHLEALASYVNDEDKLVTYKWLSKELNIHVNLAKQILFTYWDERRGKKGAVSPTFLLIGYLRDGGMRVEVVTEADLPSAKKRFANIVSEHIYSLQKNLPELELLAITEHGDAQHSAVHCSTSVIRSEHEMEILRWGKPLPNIKSAVTTQSTDTKIVKKLTSSTAKETEQQKNKPSATKPTTTTAKPNGSKQMSAFNNMFAKAKEKQKVSATTSSNTTKTKASATSSLSSTVPPKNAWFAAKPKSETTEGVATKQPTSDKDQEQVKVINNQKKERSPEIMEIETIKFQDEGASSSKSAAKNVASSSRTRKRQNTSKRNNISKKRKRIVIIESSDESGSEDTSMDIEEPPSPPEPQVIEKKARSPSPPKIKVQGGRTRVRKLVDKTFMDDDGFMITQKEYVYESCSDKDEEIEIASSKPPAASSEPPVKNAIKQKQASLLNFFKKS